MANKRVLRRRSKPGSRSTGRFFHIEVRPAREFVRFRVQDVGKPGGVQRLAGQRTSGSWDTQKWLIEKTDAHIENERLVPDSSEARKVLASLASRPVHVTGDRFKAKPRRKIPEAEKPTPAMRRAQLKNIKKAQAAVRRRKRTRSRPARTAR
ncbi:MAG TPA: hypothetical protein VEJ43_00795 [Pseudolabrys sp.]|nr:hypothetical protein [Pseudolabrys sp.]